MVAGIFSASEAAELRAEMEAAMTEQAVIWREVKVDDGAGGYVETMQVVASGVPCYRTAELSGIGETLVGGQAVQGLRWKIFLRYGTEVDEDDWIVIAGDTYTVLATASPATAQAAAVVYALKR